uniref:F-box/LRR-repeat protein 15-like leucin rich repeat domain-containing protein n=4 Tax=Timema TaxID=61471 RepID=A0A7R8Z8C8_TIMDO|nr:unnamed protein product [Timema douglasi]
MDKAWEAGGMTSEATKTHSTQFFLMASPQSCCTHLTSDIPVQSPNDIMAQIRAGFTTVDIDMLRHVHIKFRATRFLRFSTSTRIGDKENITCPSRGHSHEATGDLALILPHHHSFSHVFTLGADIVRTGRDVVDETRDTLTEKRGILRHCTGARATAPTKKKSLQITPGCSVAADDSTFKDEKFQASAPTSNTNMRHVASEISVTAGTSKNTRRLFEECAPELKYLKLPNCFWLTEGCMEALTLHHHNIEEVDLMFCWRLNDSCISNLMRSCCRLRLVNLSFIFALTDITLIVIGECCKLLEHLNIKGCWRVTDRGISAVATGCRFLKTLFIKECKFVTEHSLGIIRGRVYIDMPRQVTMDFFDFIAQMPSPPLPIMEYIE